MAGSCVSRRALAAGFVVRCRVAAARRSDSTPPVRARRSPRRPRPRAGAAALVRSCALGTGASTPSVQDLIEAARGAVERHGPARSAEAPALRQERRVRRRHRPVPRPRQGGLPERARREPVGGGYCAERDPDDPTTSGSWSRTRTASPRTSTSWRALGHMRRGGSYFETCSPASFPVDRGGLPPAGSGCGYPVPGADRQDELQAPPVRFGRLHARLHGARRGRGLLRAGRVPGPRPVPGAARRQPRAGAVRDVARREREGHRPARPHLDRRRPVLHGSGERLRRTTQRTSTPCSSTRPGPTRSCANSGACCTVAVER